MVLLLVGLLRLLLPLSEHNHLRLRGLLLAHSRVLRPGVVGPFRFDFALRRDRWLMVLSLARDLVDVKAAVGSVSDSR